MLIDPAAGSRGCAYTIGQRWKSLADCRGHRRGGLGRHVHWADQGLGLIRLPDRHSWISSPTISGSCLHNRHYAKSGVAQRAALRRSPLQRRWSRDHCCRYIPASIAVTSGDLRRLREKSRDHWSTETVRDHHLASGSSSNCLRAVSTTFSGS